MSKVFRALEKAEQEKQAKPVWEGPLIETLDVKSIEPQNGGSKLKDLAKDIETFDLPLKDEESIPFAGTGTFAIEQFREAENSHFPDYPDPPSLYLDHEYGSPRRENHGHDESGHEYRPGIA